jgi:hypothetical protein
MDCYMNSPFLHFENKRNQSFPAGELRERVLGGQAAAFELRPEDYNEQVWTRLAALSERQGLALIHLSAQPEPFLTQNTP